MWFCGSIFEKLLFPFDKIDFRKKGSESSWSTVSPEMMALIMTMKNKPQAVIMSFQR